MAWAQLWQLTAVAIAVALLVQVFRRKNPHLAHVLWLVVLVKCVTPPVWTSRSGIFCWLQRDVSGAAATEALNVRADSEVALEVSHGAVSSRPSPQPQSANGK